MTFILPESKELPNLSVAEQTKVLDNLFEPCPTLTSILIDSVMSQSYKSYGELIETCRTQLLAYLKDAETEAVTTGNIRLEISKIISAHPRLGAAKKLSDHSSNEQKSLQGSQEEAEKLIELNRQYEERFPGLRYVVFVAGRPRSVIMDNMRQRIERGDIKKERIEAFNAMCDIAIDRARKLGAKL